MAKKPPKTVKTKTSAHAAKQAAGQASLIGKIPDIAALRKMGAAPKEIARLLGVSLATLKRFCRDCPDLQDVCACKAYRLEYVQTKLYMDFKANKLSERGQLKYFEILLNSTLLDVKRRLLEIEAALRVNGMLAPDDRLEIDGVTMDDIDRVMQQLTSRGNRAAGTAAIYEDGQSDYKDHYEIVPKNNAI